MSAWPTSSGPAPRVATRRDPRYRTFGPAVAKLAAAMGLPLMPWQRYVADVALEVDENGVYRYPAVVLTVPRQSGKTSLLRPVIAHRLLTVKRGRAWLTAQLRQDARDTWAETADLIEASPLGSLARRRNTNGSETLTLGSGSTLRPFNAGDERSLHGKQSDLVFVDEVFAFSREAGASILQAVVPTQATRPGAQTWLVSTAGTAASTWLLDWITRGREAAAADIGARIAHFEWGVPEDVAETDLTDLDVYAAHHPALGFTIGRPALESAQALMSPSEFARAYGNYWTASAEWVIDPKLWESRRTTAKIAGTVAFAAEVTADRSAGVIYSAGRLHCPEEPQLHGRIGVELIERRGGTGWIAPRLLELVARHHPAAVVIDPVSPAGTVHKALAEQRRQYVPLLDFTAADLVNSHTEFLDGLVTGDIWHRTSEQLDAALRATKPRPMRETSVFSREAAEDGTSPAPLLAAVLATYGLAHPPPSSMPSIAVAR